MIALAAWVPQAHAQVSNLKVRLTDNWVLHPAFNGNTLAGYLAQQVAGAPAPNGFTIVWFARQPADTFTMEGYTGELIAEAADKVRTILTNPAAFNVSELASHTGTGAEPTETFIPMIDGLAITDPLQPYAGTMSSVALEWLVGLGAEGATDLSALSASEEVEDCSGLNHSPDGLIQPLLRTHIHQLESIASSQGAVIPESQSTDIFWGERCTSFERPAGPWGLIGPGLADGAGNCWYSRPRQKVEICCRRTLAGCVCTTVITPSPRGPQTGSCPGYAPGAPCHPAPRCVIPWVP